MEDQKYSSCLRNRGLDLVPIIAMAATLFAETCYGSCSDFPVYFGAKIHVTQVSNVKDKGGNDVSGCWVQGTSETQNWKKISGFVQNLKVCRQPLPIDIQADVSQECCDPGGPPCSYSYEKKIWHRELGQSYNPN